MQRHVHVGVHAVLNVLAVKGFEQLAVIAECGMGVQGGVVGIKQQLAAGVEQGAEHSLRQGGRGQAQAQSQRYCQQRNTLGFLHRF